MNGISLALVALLSALGASLAGFLLHGARDHQRRVVSLLLILSAVSAFGAGMMGIAMPPDETRLPIGLPWLAMHLRLDALSGFFLAVLGMLLGAISLYSMGYLRHAAAQRSLTPLSIFLPLFVTGMLGVLLADDAYSFMIFWELMSVASYFLVTFEHEQEHNRKAGFLYLLMAHLGGLLILGGFAVLYAAGGSFEFDTMRAAALSSPWASLAFLLALSGFGMKAGLIPLHAWLPEAHPAAPSNVSALMSGVMIKIAIFGFLRMIWDLVGLEHASGWWGGLLLAMGSVSAVGGILLALQTRDLKRVLAYSSVENIGIITIGLGMGMIFSHESHLSLAALGLTAALYHVLNHALFKGVLFMGAGSILQSAHSSDLDKLGGLIRRMPRTAALFLIGSLSISALPPFNGFVSEWLTFQAALMAPQLQSTLLSALIPFSAAMLALAGALAAACFVKVFGIVFQGMPRSPAAAAAGETNAWMQAGMALPAVACLLLGVFPMWVLPVIDAVPQALIQASLGTSTTGNWLWLTPIAQERASYSPLIVLAVLLLAGSAFLLIHWRTGAKRRTEPWTCGHPHLDSRMQYTSAAFSQPLRWIFANLYQSEDKIVRTEHGHTLLTGKLRYELHVRDPMWRYLYEAVRQFSEWLTHHVDWLHHRTIHGYLSFSFVTLLTLLGLLL